MPAASAGGAARAAGGRPAAAKKTAAGSPKKGSGARKAASSASKAPRKAPVKRLRAADDDPASTTSPEPTEGDDDQDENDDQDDEDDAGPARESITGPLLKPGDGDSAAQTGAGIVLGILAYAVLANYLRGGIPGVKKWFAAKWLNKTTAPPAETGAREGGEAVTPPKQGGKK